MYLDFCRKLSGPRETGRTCCKGADKKPSVAESTGRIPRGEKSSAKVI